MSPKSHTAGLVPSYFPSNTVNKIVQDYKDSEANNTQIAMTELPNPQEMESMLKVIDEPWNS